MKISKSRLKEIIADVLREESDYQAFFKKALEKSGKSIPQMSDDEKKEFFNKIQKAWKGKGEKTEGNAFGAAVAKAKKDGDDSFEVDGKKYKVEEDSIEEGASTEEKRIAMLAVRKQAKYRNVDLATAIRDQIRELEELERDAKKGKIK